MRPTAVAAALLAGLLAAPVAARSAPAAAPGSPAGVPCGSLGRREAVLRGMEYSENFFEGGERRAALGADAVSIFLELGETAADAEIRRRALVEARKLAAPLARSYVAPHGLDDHDSLLGALSLLPDSGPLHLSKKLLLSLLSAVRSRLDGRDPDEAYYGERIDASRLGALDGDAFFDLLIAAYTVERARLAFADLPAPGLGLGPVLRFALSAPLVSFGVGDDARAEDDFYRATHAAYVLSDYSRFRLQAGDLGPVLPHLRAQVPAVLSTADLEAAAEIVDVLRQLGETDADADVCRLTRTLLAAQRPDGSWRRPDAEDAYDAIHPTWVALHALRERVFLPDGAWPRRVRALLAPAAPARLP